jgi:hypothetical protein
MEDVKFYVVDVKEEIKKERLRLQNIILNKGTVIPWIIEWLSRSDELHYIQEGDVCDVCGKKFQFYIKLDFSCEEYPCSMFICKDCLNKMLNTLENKSKH